MNLFNDFIKLDLKKNMGLYNLTDEFFCVYLNSIREKNNNILVVVDTIFEANKIYNNLSLFTDNVYLFPMDDFLTSEALAVSPDLMIKRLETINNIIFTQDYGIMQRFFENGPFIKWDELNRIETACLKMKDILHRQKIGLRKIPFSLGNMKGVRI
jgi:transcription-repair coupling factor (superfamily II helicase)